MYELDVWGNGTQGTVGNRQTLEFGVALGGNALTNVTFGTTAFEDTHQAFRFRVIARVICNTDGATGTWTSFIDAGVADFGSLIAPGNNDFGRAFSCESTTTTTVDTTSDQTFAVQAAWGATTGSPTLTSQVSLFKRIA